MGAAYTANRVLSGSWAQVWVNGEPWAEATGITMKITENRTDVQQGIDVGSKLVGMKGEGTITVDHVYTSKISLVKDKLKGKDTLVQIVCKVADPDSVGGKEESWVINDAVFTEMPLMSMKNGEAATKEWPFNFPPTKIENTSAIE